MEYNIIDIVRELNLLNSKAFNLKEKTGLIEKQDARPLFFDQIQQKLVVVISIFNLYLYVGYDNGKASPEKLISVMDIPELNANLDLNEKIKKNEILMSDFLKLALVDFTYFHVDNLLANLVREHEKFNKPEELKNANSKMKLYELIKYLSDVLGKDDGYVKKDFLSDDDKGALQALLHIRNSLHNNGIHRGTDFKYTNNWFKYEFIKDKEVECIKWRHYVKLVEDILIVIEKILLHAEIKQAVYIKDDFAHEFEEDTSDGN